MLVEPDGLIVPESMAIAHFLERRYPEVPLVPHDPAALAKVLVRAYEVDRLRRAYRPIEQLFKAPDMWTYSRQTIAQAPAAVRTELAIWQSYLSAEPYLGGEAFSLGGLCRISGFGVPTAQGGRLFGVSEHRRLYDPGRSTRFGASIVARRLAGRGESEFIRRSDAAEYGPLKAQIFKVPRRSVHGSRGES